MPVDRWNRGSLSPEVRGRSVTPPPAPFKDAPTNDPGLSTRVKYEPEDVQRIRIEKLFADPTKEIALPTGPRERTLRAPAEMMKNVQGSSSGAGSGEFHVYKQSRRREYERLRIMEDKNRALEEQKAFKARQDARDAAADAKTAKNRAKRMKRKPGRKGADGEEGAPESGGSKLRKLEPNGGHIVFKRPGQESDEEEDGPGENGEEVGPSVEDVEKPVEVPVLAVEEEGKIVILDED